MPYTGFPNYGYQPSWNTVTPLAGTSILKVTGFDGAKAFAMGANQSAALFDANDNVFWVKTTDAAGFATYKAYRYVEDVQSETGNQVTENQVTREEFDELKKLVDTLAKGVS